ncbi:uncharacterized protein LOC142662006 [Rhinoderma darwinii]|uniref:uncharacterized protein LOC142662006 n=1 Tax=Rhinoderma darwinii TaxID=43563 RepID=UPI003F67CD97
MKVLLLSVALLFFTGAQGRYFWQQDEPNQGETADKSIETILHDGMSIVSDLLKNLDYSDIAKEYNVKEKLEAAKKHGKKLEKAMEKYYEEVWKKFDEQLHEKFPVFRKNVVPILQEFDDALEEQLKKLVKDVVPVGSDLVSGITKHMLNFFENLESIAEKGRDRLRSEMDSLRVKLQPYVEDVHAEYEKYRNSLQGEIQKDYKDLKQDVEKNMEMLKERAKPHLDNIRKKFPDGKEVQEKVDEFLKKLQEILSSVE